MGLKHKKKRLLDIYDIGKGSGNADFANMTEEEKMQVRKDLGLYYIPGGGGEIIYLHFNEDGSIPYKDKEQTIEYTKEELMSLNNEIINNPAKDVKIIITDMNYVDFYGACDKCLDTTTVVLHFSGIWRDNDDNSYKRALFSNIVRNGSGGSGSHLTLIEIYLDKFSTFGVNQAFYNIPLDSCML